MSDELTQEEKSLIKEAINTSKHQKISNGISGLPSLVWDAANNKLVYSSSQKPLSRLRWGRNQSISRQKRRQKLLEIYNPQTPQKDYAKKLGVALTTIEKDLYALRHEGFLPKSE